MSATNAGTHAACGTRLGHVTLKVTDIAAWTSDLAKCGFLPAPATDTTHPMAVTLRQGAAVLALAPSDTTDAGAERQGLDEVVDIALTVPDVAAAYEAAVARGARPLAQPAPAADGYLSAVLGGFGRTTHTLRQHTAPVHGQAAAYAAGPGLERIDHLAVCLPEGDLASTAAFYETVFGFTTVFKEHITITDKAMNSIVVRNQAGDLTLVLAEPSHEATELGQVERFVNQHGAAGVQHIALATSDITHSVTELQRNGMTFLDTPDAYYKHLASRLTTTRHATSTLRRLGILADQDDDGQLYQTFTRPLDAAGTFFLELIERDGATTFGSNNIKALYEAVEQHDT